MFGAVLHMTIRCDKRDFMIFAWYSGEHPVTSPSVSPPDTGGQLPGQLHPGSELPGGELPGAERPRSTIPKADLFCERMLRTFYLPRLEWSLRTPADWGAAVMQVACELTEQSEEDVRRLVDEWDQSVVARYREDSAARPRPEQRHREARLQAYLEWRTQLAQQSLEWDDYPGCSGGATLEQSIGAATMASNWSAESAKGLRLRL